MKRLLVLNTGSSSLKWTVFDSHCVTVSEGAESWHSDDTVARAAQLAAVLHKTPTFDCVGHRVVHGGVRFRDPVWIDADVRKALVELSPLAPEHMALALLGIDAVTQVFPGVAQAAVFDTAFHATLSEAAAGYGLPHAWTERHGIRRFGFHGLSVSYACRRVRELSHGLPSRLIVCHLGSGCSVTAVKDGVSVDTSMGFSPMEGLMMATRSGSVDPGVLLYLLEQGQTVASLRDGLTHQSGLLGVSGISADLRQVRAAAAQGDAHARLAIDRFVLSIQRALGAMTAVLGGVDALVFTGGIGEHDAVLRADVAEALSFAGVQLAVVPNHSGQGDREISTPASNVRVQVVTAREDREILAAVLRLTNDGPISQVLKT
jgi:acetate kinase